MSRNPPCIQCELADNSNGLFACNGCRRSFCGNHLADHSNELRNRFEYITNEYNLISDRFRTNRHTLDERRCTTIENGIDTIKFELDRNQKNANYCERDLNEWSKRLENLQVQLTNTNESRSLLGALDRLLNSKGFPVYLSCILLVVSLYYINAAWLLTISSFSRRFTDANERIRLLDNERVAEHNGSDYLPGTFRLEQIYTRDIHHVWFVMETLSPSTTFIGIARTKGEQSITTSPGWFIGNRQEMFYQSEENLLVHVFRKIWLVLTGNQPKHYYRADVKQGDTIELVIDCANAKLSLTNTRTKIREELDVDLIQAPLPWKIWISLNRHGNRVRLQ